MIAPLLLALAQEAGPPPDWVIPAGRTVIYDTAGGVARVHSLTVEAGGVLRAVGPNPFVVIADATIYVDGRIDASGFDAKLVGTLFTPFQPEVGAAGACGGGQGGMGSPSRIASSPKGGDGFVEHYGFLAHRGGRGGETGTSLSVDKNVRRGAGGGGGAFGPDEAGGEAGLVAQAGSDGHPRGIGALSGMSPPQGGAVNVRPFVDGDPANDFWGRKRDAASGSIVTGELLAPSSGAGGGAGGDAIHGLFPTIPFGPPYIDKKGAGGGGGGGLVVLLADVVRVGASGSIAADGGAGATGENVLGFDHIAGSSGGGSGGMIVLEADRVDLGQASADALTAIGGAGGIGMSATVDWSKGGDGGPGLIQVHVADPAAALLLPPGATLADLSAPNGHVLLPELH